MKFMRYYLLSLLLLCGQAYAAADMGNTSVISPTDASNGSGTCPSWLGSAAPSTLDDAGRCLQGALAREWENRSFAITSTGSANAYVVAYTIAPSALRSGQVYSFITNFGNTGSATVNINSLGAKTIKKDVAGTLTALSSGDMASGQFVMLAYNGTDMIWVNWQGAAGTAATTTQQLTGTSTAVLSSPDSVAALWEAGSDITDGAAITIGEGGYFNLITSTTAITSFSITTDKAGRSFRVRFDTARTLTHNATSLILPSGANITTAVGDIAFVRSLGGGNVVVEAYTKASGGALVSGGNRLALASDVSNSTTSFADVTALSFAVTSGVKYKFKFTIVYDVPATTTGSAWSINGPATTRLSFKVDASLGNAYDTPATAGSSSTFTTSNLTVIEGIVQPSANGTVIARFKSEVGTSAVTAIAGISYVEWEAI